MIQKWRHTADNIMQHMTSLSCLQALSAANGRADAHISAPSPALDLNDPGTLDGIFSDAASHVYNTRDSTFPNFLNQQSDATTSTVASTAANLADQVDGATNLGDIRQVQGSLSGKVRLAAIVTSVTYSVTMNMYWPSRFWHERNIARHHSCVHLTVLCNRRSHLKYRSWLMASLPRPPSSLPLEVPEQLLQEPPHLPASL